MQSTYWLEKVLKMISLYVNALLCTLQHIVMQLSRVNSPNWHRCVESRVWQYAVACTKVHWRTRRSFSAPSLTSKYFAFAFVWFPVQSPRSTPTLFYEKAGRFFVRQPVPLRPTCSAMYWLRKLTLETTYLTLLLLLLLLLQSVPSVQFLSGWNIKKSNNEIKFILNYLK